METTYRSLPEFIVKTDDIEHISNRACDNLKLGDEVILVSGDEQKKFIVSSKSLEEMRLAFVTSKEVTEVIYKKADERWSYDKTETTTLASFPSMTEQGGKFARVKADGSGIEYSETSKFELLAVGTILKSDADTVQIEFTENVDVSKITAKTILILTYANSFIITPLSATGEARVVGNVINDSYGASLMGKLKFTLDAVHQNLKVETNVEWGFTPDIALPIPYLFALTLI